MNKYNDNHLFEQVSKGDIKQTIMDIKTLPEMIYSFDPIEIEYEGFLMTRGPMHNLIQILPKEGEILPDALLSKYTQIRLARQAIDRYRKTTQ